MQGSTSNAVQEFGCGLCGVAFVTMLAGDYENAASGRRIAAKMC